MGIITSQAQKIGTVLVLKDHPSSLVIFAKSFKVTLFKERSFCEFAGDYEINTCKQSIMLTQ